MIKRPDIPHLAKHHLRELREKWGVEPTLEESIWIVDLCKEVLQPAGQCDLDLIGQPIQAGASDVWLWPFTIGASIWLERCAARWFGDDEMLWLMAEVYTLVHARDREAFTAMRTREQALAKMREWELTLNCTWQELIAAMREVYTQLEIGDEEQQAPDAQKGGRAGDKSWTAIVARLEAVTGIKAEYWLWEVSLQATRKRLELAESYQIAMGGGKITEDDPIGRALKNLGLAKGAIVKAHKGDTK